MISQDNMSQVYLQQRRRPKQWYELVWDAIRELFIQILYVIIDGIVVRVKQEIRKALGYEDDWRTQYR
jgi:hypothetical protein